MKEPELTLSCCMPLRIWVLVILSRLQIVGISECWSFYCLCKFWIWVLIHACVPAKLQISVFFSNEFCDAAKVSDHPYEDVGKWQSFIGRFSPNLAIKPDINHKSSIILQHFWLLTETKYRDLTILTPFFFFTSGNWNPQRSFHIWNFNFQVLFLTKFGQ